MLRDFSKSLTLREMTLWVIAFTLGLIAGNFEHLISFYIVGSFAAVFVLFRYILPEKGSIE